LRATNDIVDSAKPGGTREWRLQRRQPGGFDSSAGDGTSVGRPGATPHCHTQLTPVPQCDNRLPDAGWHPSFFAQRTRDVMFRRHRKTNAHGDIGCKAVSMDDVHALRCHHKVHPERSSATSNVCEHVERLGELSD
jgi:hypothetical protein